jgi:rod shape-determining protein MreD
VSPVVAIGGVHPNVVLVAAVLVTVVWGFGPGVVWAFASGVTANLLTRDPLGSIPLSLLVVAAAAAGGERLFGRLQWVYPVVAIAIGSVVADTISLGVMRMVDLPLSGDLPVQRILAAAVLNAALGAIAIVPTRMLAARRVAAERPAW